MRLALIPKSELDRVRGADAEQAARLALIADVCRLNTLVAIKCAGSGHLGSSFSALDIFVHLLYHELNVAELGFDHPERDVFFSSKGHDVPGLYAALYGLGVIPQAQLLRLRRLGGLDGHPDVGIPGIEANSGSLGMGISKGRGVAWTKWSRGLGGRVVVMTGDGELQEGQNWEALQAAAHERLGTLWVVVDRNELQSDKPTEEIVALGDLEEKLRSFGWDVRTCDGHDHEALREVFAAFRDVEDRPNALVARTVKGKGVSFMERSAALAEGGGYYRWHAGAPGDEDFERARDELVARIEEQFSRSSVSGCSISSRWRPRGSDARYSLEAEPESGAGAPLQKVTDEYVVEAYGDALVELGRTNDRLVVLDADLASDCRVRGFELAFPDRFVECGIAEQDMVSTAAGLARHGFLPVVNSFASFLASRANEQIYNQESEQSKVVYALALRGPDPRWSREIAPEPARHLPPRGAPEHDDRAAGHTRGDERAPAVGSRGGGGERRHPARDRPFPTSHRASVRLRARGGSGCSAARGRRRGSPRIRPRAAARGSPRVRASRRPTASTSPW